MTSGKSRAAWEWVDRVADLALLPCLAALWLGAWYPSLTCPKVAAGGLAVCACAKAITFLPLWRAKRPAPAPPHRPED